MIDKDVLMNECRTEADRVVRAARLPEFGVPIDLVASFTELLAAALAEQFHKGAIYSIDEAWRRISERS